jgi:hypothetical protein
MVIQRHRPAKAIARKRPLKARRKVCKHVVAIAFDIFDQRAILKPNRNPEPGEPVRGVGPLNAPWNGSGDRPLAWAMTALGRDVLQGQLQLPDICPNLLARVPQPGHGRWRNPRANDIIRIRISPGIYTMFVDDLDCSTHKVDIIKSVRIFSAEGNCDFVGGGYVQVPGEQNPRPYLLKDVAFTEPKGWSLQPAPITFGGQLIIPDIVPAVLTVSIDKRAANPEQDAVYTNGDSIRILINP